MTGFGRVAAENDGRFAIRGQVRGFPVVSDIGKPAPPDPAIGDNRQCGKSGSSDMLEVHILHEEVIAAGCLNSGDRVREISAAAVDCDALNGYPRRADFARIRNDGERRGDSETDAGYQPE